VNHHEHNALLSEGGRAHWICRIVIALSGNVFQTMPPVYVLRMERGACVLAVLCWRQLTCLFSVSLPLIESRWRLRICSTVSGHAAHPHTHFHCFTFRIASWWHFSTLFCSTPSFDFGHFITLLQLLFYSFTGRERTWRWRTFFLGRRKKSLKASHTQGDDR
jgi:hypothetical protein